MQKLRQYDDFMKKVEHDPYTALFGKSWRSFGGEDTEPKAGRTPSPSPKETSVPRDERVPEDWPSKFTFNKISANRYMCSKTTPFQEHAHEYEIDPITNRKVWKTAASSVSEVEHVNPQIKDPQGAPGDFWSPISPSSRLIRVDEDWALSDANPLNKGVSYRTLAEGSGWLVQESISKIQEPQAETEPRLQTHDAKPATMNSRIESALDRHLSSNSTAGKNDRPKLRYKPEENKAEDVDLLRPSDVRASAGLRGNSPKESDLDKRARRQKLERDYESCSLDREIQLAGEAERNKPVHKRVVWPVEKIPGPELRFGSWLKGTLPDTEITDKEVSKGTPAAWVNELSDVRDFDPISVDQTSNPMPISDNKLASGPSNAASPEAHSEARDEVSKLKALLVPLLASEPSNTVSPEAHSEATDKVSTLKAVLVPFKAKLDAMKADYDTLRQHWLQETRRLKEKAAKKEEEMKAQRVAKRAREIHEEEIKTQKVAMEAMEMRSGVSTNTAKKALAKGIENDDGEKPRRLQSFLQGEGDMASNVHEFAGRDRWYKRKAPHAIDAKDVELERKLQKLATDQALIREVRGIYEDTYGTIDTKHRQLPVSPDPSEKTFDLTQLLTFLMGRLPSRAEIEPTQGLGQPQIPEALRIVQKLYGQLREAQSIIQDYRSQAKQALELSDQITNKIETRKAFKKSIIQILRTSEKLAAVDPGDMMAQASVEEIAAANSMKPTTNRPISTTAPKSTNLEAQKAAKLNTYRILAYDSITQKVISAEATTLTPFSKEESLLPLDALNRLHNPGSFLPHVTSLVDKGYEPVSGTSTILVFKKEVIPQEPADIKKTDAIKEPNPTRCQPDRLPEGSIGDWGGNWPLNFITEEDIEKCHQARSDETKVEQKTGKEHQKPEESRKIAMDGIQKEKQPFKESSSGSPRHTSGNKVHRQETVFSGSRHGTWVGSSVKHKKSKRAADRRAKFTRHVFMGGAFTAACCYCVGVASEMMHN